MAKKTPPSPTESTTTGETETPLQSAFNKEIGETGGTGISLTATQPTSPFKFSSLFQLQPGQVKLGKMPTEEETAIAMATGYAPLDPLKALQLSAQVQTMPASTTRVYIPPQEIKIGGETRKFEGGYLPEKAPPTAAEYQLGLQGGVSLLEVVERSRELAAKGTPPPPEVMAMALKARIDRQEENIYKHIEGKRGDFLKVLAEQEPSGWETEPIDPYPEIIKRSPWSRIAAIFKGGLPEELEKAPTEYKELVEWCKRGNPIKILAALPDRSLVDLAHVGLGLAELGGSIAATALNTAASVVDGMASTAFASIGYKPGLIKNYTRAATQSPLFQLNTTIAQANYKSDLEDIELEMRLQYLEGKMTAEQYNNIMAQINTLKSPEAMSEAVLRPSLMQNLGGLVLGIGDMLFQFGKNPLQYTLDHPGNVLLLAEMGYKMGKSGVPKAQVGLDFVRDKINKIKEFKAKLEETRIPITEAEAYKIYQDIKAGFETPFRTAEMPENTPEGGIIWKEKPISLMDVVEGIKDQVETAKVARDIQDLAVRRILTPEIGDLKPGDFELREVDTRAMDVIPGTVDEAIIQKYVNDPVAFREFVKQFDATHPDGILVFKNPETGLLTAADVPSSIMVRVIQEVLKDPDKINSHGELFQGLEFSNWRVLDTRYAVKELVRIEGITFEEAQRNIKRGWGEPLSTNPDVVRVVGDYDYESAIQTLMGRYDIDLPTARRIVGEVRFRSERGDYISPLPENVPGEFYEALGELYSRPGFGRFISIGELYEFLRKNTERRTGIGFNSPLDMFARFLEQNDATLERFVQKRISGERTLFGQLEEEVPGSGKALFDYLYRRGSEVAEKRNRLATLEKTIADKEREIRPWAKTTPELEELLKERDNLLKEVITNEKTLMQGAARILNKYREVALSEWFREMASAIPENIRIDIAKETAEGRLKIGNKQARIKLTPDSRTPLIYKTGKEWHLAEQGTADFWEAWRKENGAYTNPELMDRIYNAMTILKDRPGAIAEINYGGHQFSLVRVKGEYYYQHIFPGDEVSFMEGEVKRTGFVKKVDTQRGIARVSLGKDKQGNPIIREVDLLELELEKQGSIGKKQRERAARRELGRLKEDLLPEEETEIERRWLEETEQEYIRELMPQEGEASGRIMEATELISTEPIKQAHDGFILRGRFSGGKIDPSGRLVSYYLPFDEAARLFDPKVRRISDVIARSLDGKEITGFDHLAKTVRAGDAIEIEIEEGHPVWYRVEKVSPAAIELTGWVGEKIGKGRLKKQTYIFRTNDEFIGKVGGKLIKGQIKVAERFDMPGGLGVKIITDSGREILLRPGDEIQAMINNKMISGKIGNIEEHRVGNISIHDIEFQYLLEKEPIKETERGVKKVKLVLRPGEDLSKVKRTIAIPDGLNFEVEKALSDNPVRDSKTWQDTIAKATQLVKNSETKMAAFLGGAFMTMMAVSPPEAMELSEEDRKRAMAMDPVWWFKRLWRFITPGRGGVEGWAELGLKVGGTILAFGLGARLFNKYFPLVGEKPTEMGWLGRTEPLPIASLRQIQRLKNYFGKYSPHSAEMWKTIQEITDPQEIMDIVREKGTPADQEAVKTILERSDNPSADLKKFVRILEDQEQLVDYFSHIGNEIVLRDEALKRITNDMIFGEQTIDPATGKVIRTGGLHQLLETIAGYPDMINIARRIEENEGRIATAKETAAQATEIMKQLDEARATRELTPEEINAYETARTTFEQADRMAREGTKIMAQFKRMIQEKHQPYRNFAVLADIESLRNLEEGWAYWNMQKEIKRAALDEAPDARVRRDLQEELRGIDEKLTQIERQWKDVAAGYHAVLGTPLDATPSMIADAVARQFELPPSANDLIASFLQKWVKRAKENGVDIKDVYDHYYPAYADPKLAPPWLVDAISNERYGKISRLKGWARRERASQGLFVRPIKEWEVPFYALNLTVDNLISWLGQLAHAMSYEGFIKGLDDMAKRADNIARSLNELGIDKIELDSEGMTGLSRYLMERMEAVRRQPKIGAQLTNKAVDQIYAWLYQKTKNRKFLERRMEFHKDMFAAFNNLAVNSVLGTFRTLLVNSFGSYFIASLRVSPMDMIKGAVDRLKETKLPWEEKMRMIRERDIPAMKYYLDNLGKEIGAFNNSDIPIGLSTSDPAMAYAEISNQLMAQMVYSLNREFLRIGPSQMFSQLIQLGGKMYGFTEMIARDIITRRAKRRFLDALERGATWEEILNSKIVDWDAMVEGTKEKYAHLYQKAYETQIPALRKARFQHMAESLANDILFQTQHIHPLGTEMGVFWTRQGPLVASMTAFWQFPMMYIGNMIDVLAHHPPKVAARMMARYLAASYLACKATQLLTGIDLSDQFLGGEWWLPLNFNLSQQGFLPSFGPWKVGGPVISPIANYLTWLAYTNNKKEADARQLAAFAAYNMIQLPPGTLVFKLGKWRFDGRNLVFDQLNPRTGKLESYSMPVGIPSQYLPFGQQFNALMQAIVEWNRINEAVNRGTVHPDLAIPPAGLVSRALAFGGSYYRGTPLGYIPWLHAYFGYPGPDLTARRFIMTRINKMTSLNPRDWDDPSMYWQMVADFYRAMGVPYPNQQDIGISGLDFNSVALALIAGSNLFGESREPPTIGGARVKPPSLGTAPVPREVAQDAFFYLLWNRAQQYYLANENRFMTAEEEKDLREIVNIITAERPDVKALQQLRDQSIEQYGQEPVSYYIGKAALRDIWNIAIDMYAGDTKQPPQIKGAKVNPPGR